MAMLSSVHLKITSLIENDTRPSSLLECLDHPPGSGSPIDLRKYLEYAAKQEELDGLEDQMSKLILVESSSLQTEQPTKKKRKWKFVKSICPYYFDENGKQVFLRPRQTVWYYMYVLHPNRECAKWKKKFRR
jgi:hypothetical protein